MINSPQAASTYAELSTALVVPGFASAILIVGLATVVAPEPRADLLFSIATLIVTVTLCFSRFRISVLPSELVIRFLLPRPARRLRVADVVAIRPLELPFWYGWGIRVIGRRKTLWRGGGHHGFEFTLRDGGQLILGVRDARRFQQKLVGEQRWRALVDMTAQETAHKEEVDES